MADYPFTTIKPSLGIVKMENGYGNSFVMADIPGIIEGAHEGKGLGHRFLRHIERTRVLAIMVDAEAEDPEAVAEELIQELRLYSPLLVEKPMLKILTKTDSVLAEDLKIPEGWMAISSFSRDGLKPLILKLKDLSDGTKENHGQRVPVKVG